MELNSETFPLIETNAPTRLRPVARVRVQSWFQAIVAGLLVTGVSNAGVVTYPEDLTFQDTLPNGTIRAVAIPASPTRYAAVLAGGDFTSINGSAQNYLVLLDDLGYTVEFEGYPNGSVYSIVVQPD